MGLNNRIRTLKKLLVKTRKKIDSPARGDDVAACEYILGKYEQKLRIDRIRRARVRAEKRRATT